MPTPGTGDRRVAAVMITHNRRDEALRTLGRLADLPERPRVVVVDNGSTDGTAAAVAGRFPQVEVIEAGKNLGAAGRNLGVERVDAPYVAFCDDDSWPDPGALRRAADLLDRHPKLAVVTGRILVGPEDRDDPICAEIESSPLPPDEGMPGSPLVSFLAGASVVRRSAFREVGGFHAGLFLGGEEEWLGADLLAAGYSMAYVPDVTVHHHPSTARDPHLRRAQGIRNTLWFAWLRRPWPSALRRTLWMACTVPRDRVSLSGFARALVGLPRVLHLRRVVPPEIEDRFRRLDRPQMTSKARRYVS